MNCAKIKKFITEYLESGLDSETDIMFEKHIAKCRDCKNELENISLLWSKLSDIPQDDPGPMLRKRFYSMLDEAGKEELLKEHKISFSEKLNLWISKWWPAKPVYQLGVSLVLLIVGLFLGQFTTAYNYNKQLSSDKGNDKTNDLVINSLNNDFSSIERMNGLVMSQKVDNPDNYMLSKILYTLNTDPDVNVRLMSVDTLKQYSSNPWIKSELIKSLYRQFSPLVQIALIETLVENKDERVANTLIVLINNPNTNLKVKKIARWGIQQVI